MGSYQAFHEPKMSLETNGHLAERVPVACMPSRFEGTLKQDSGLSQVFSSRNLGKIPQAHVLVLVLCQSWLIFRNFDVMEQTSSRLMIP